jgi:hypothetical protein
MHIIQNLKDDAQIFGKCKRDIIQRIEGNGCSSYPGDIPFDFRPECLLYWQITFMFSVSYPREILIW